MAVSWVPSQRFWFIRSGGLKIWIFNKLTGDKTATDLEITRKWNFLPRDTGQFVEAVFGPNRHNRRVLLASNG